MEGRKWSLRYSVANIIIILPTKPTQVNRKHGCSRALAGNVLAGIPDILLFSRKFLKVSIFVDQCSSDIM